MSISACRSIEVVLDISPDAVKCLAGISGVWLLLCPRRRVNVFVRGSCLTIPKGECALVSSEDIDANCFSAFSGTALLIYGSEISPHDRKLLVGSTNKGSFQNSWSRLLYAYIENLDEDTLRFVCSNESDWSLVKHQIMALLRRTLREELRGTSGYKRHASSAMNARPHAEHLFREVCAWVVANLANPEMSLLFVANHFHLSSRSIQNLFSLYGKNITFVSFLRQQRLFRAREMLIDASQAHRTISEICWSCGFSDPVYFGKVFRRFFGSAPGEMRRAQTLDELVAL